MALGRSCGRSGEALFPQETEGEMCYSRAQTIQQLGTPLRKSQLLGMCEAVPVTHGAGF